MDNLAAIVATGCLLAGNRLAEFSARRQDLDRLDRTAIESQDFRARALEILAKSGHEPNVETTPTWYY